MLDLKYVIHFSIVKIDYALFLNCNYTDQLKSIQLANHEGKLWHCQYTTVIFWRYPSSISYKCDKSTHQEEVRVGGWVTHRTLTHKTWVYVPCLARNPRFLPWCNVSMVNNILKHYHIREHQCLSHIRQIFISSVGCLMAYTSTVKWVWPQEHLCLFCVTHAVSIRPKQPDYFTCKPAVS